MPSLLVGAGKGTGGKTISLQEVGHAEQRLQVSKVRRDYLGGGELSVTRGIQEKLQKGFQLSRKIPFNPRFLRICLHPDCVYLCVCTHTGTDHQPITLTHTHLTGLVHLHPQMCLCLTLSTLCTGKRPKSMQPAFLYVHKRALNNVGTRPPAGEADPLHPPGLPEVQLTFPVPRRADTLL